MAYSRFARLPLVRFSDDFSGFSNGTFNGGQADTGLTMAHSGDLTNWLAFGFDAAHVVDRANVDPDTSNPLDFALMVYDDNVLWLQDAIASSNTLGAGYEISFDISPAVYQDSSQSTAASDGLVVSLLRQSDGSVLAAQSFQPGAWAGSMNFSPVSFSYVGDGTGDLVIEVTSLDIGSDHFGGAMDNLTLTQVPEPAGTALLGLSGLMLLRRKRRK